MTSESYIFAGYLKVCYRCKRLTWWAKIVKGVSICEDCE